MVPDGIAHGEGFEIGFAAEVLYVAGGRGRVSRASMGSMSMRGCKVWQVVG